MKIRARNKTDIWLNKSSYAYNKGTTITINAHDWDILDGRLIELDKPKLTDEIMKSNAKAGYKPKLPEKYELLEADENTELTPTGEIRLKINQIIDYLEKRGK